MKYSDLHPMITYSSREFYLNNCIIAFATYLISIIVTVWQYTSILWKPIWIREQNVFRLFKNYIQRDFSSHFININAFINGWPKGTKLWKNNPEFVASKKSHHYENENEKMNSFENCTSKLLMAEYQSDKFCWMISSLVLVSLQKLPKI